MKRGSVYLVSLGGHRQAESSERGHTDGVDVTVLRPVVLVSREAINRHSPAVLVCPIVDASIVGQPYPSDVAVSAPDGGLTSDGVVLTGQLRAVDRRQIVRFLGDLSDAAMRRVDSALRITLDLD